MNLNINPSEVFMGGEHHKPRLRVVTHKNWLAKQFLDALPGYDVVQDWGFDINPQDVTDKTLWWAPGAWVASAKAAGVNIPLLSCGPYWLESLPWEYLKRTVMTMPVSQCRQGHWWEYYDELFIKLPEAKMDSFPARTHLVNKHWATTLDQYHLEPHHLVQLQEPVKFVMETRHWVHHRAVVTSSLYRINDAVWGEDAYEQQSVNPFLMTRMRRFANQVARDERVKAPPGYVLDVGVLDDWETIVVVEANAAWSSGPYDGHPKAIYDTIRASHDYSGHNDQWSWARRTNPVWGRVQPLKVVSHEP